MNKLLLAALVSGALFTPAFAADYTIMAPAAPGGGWDQTARTMQTVLQEEGIAVFKSEHEIVNGFFFGPGLVIDREVSV